MQKYAAEHSKSKSWKSVDGQVAYLIYELHHSEKAANAVLNNTSLNLKIMTEEFERKFERAADWAANLPARVRYATIWSDRMADSGTASITEEQTAFGVDMQKRASQLYSSDNFEYLTLEESEEAKKEKQARQDRIDNVMLQLATTRTDLSSGAIPENVALAGVELTQSRETSVRTKSQLSVSDALVETPFIEADFNGYIIGSKSGSLDTAPNYISQIDITKTNGEINQYKLQIVYQIRPGEDPNKLDKLFSQVRYNKIKLRYGDASTNSLFKDTEAIITDITQSRDYVGMRITYTVSATSACNYVTSTTFDFPATSDKPSNVIRDLLYNNGQTSQLLLEVFPGMQNKTTVNSNNWLPTNDTVVNIPAKSNLSTTQYISYLTSIMSNQSNDPNAIIRNSTYYLTYQDDANNGSYFKISEISKNNKTTVPTAYVYDVDINFPDENQIYNFSVNSDNAWSLLYNYADKPQEYVYNINEEGVTEQIYSPNYFSSHQQMNEIQKNWWTQMTEYPISAQLTMKGLLKPISLMDYLNIDVRFYGVKHMTSGLYVIISQQDTLSGAGFKTNLGLLRVGDTSIPYVPLSSPKTYVERKPGNTLESVFTMVEEPVGTEKEQLEFNRNLEKLLKEVVTNPPVIVTTTSQPQTSVNEGSETSSSGTESPESSVVYSYQFSGIGNTYTLSGDKFKTSDKKVATVDKNGVVTAKGSGTCTITVTKDGKEREVSIRVPKVVSRKTVLQPWWDAQKKQQEWSWNARYDWTRPTIANSDTQGTCITMPSVSAQRCGLIKSTRFLTMSGGDSHGISNFAVKEGRAAMDSVNSNYWWHKFYYTNTKSVKSLVNSGDILEGDILGSWSHTFIYYGKNSKGELLYNESGHAGSHRSDNGPGANRTSLKQKNNANSNSQCLGIYRINVFRIATTCKNGTVTGSRDWMAGQNVKIEYKPRKGYKLSKLTVDGKKWSITKHPNYVSFNKIDAKHKVSVEFIKA